MDKRQFSRFELDVPVVVSQSDTSWTSKLVDISLKGLLIEMPKVWQSAQKTFEANIRIPDHPISMTVEKVHEHDNMIGFKCMSIDLESIATLKRLVELNLGDEQLLKREISQMIN